MWQIFVQIFQANHDEVGCNFDVSFINFFMFPSRIDIKSEYKNKTLKKIFERNVKISTNFMWNNEYGIRSNIILCYTQWSWLCIAYIHIFILNEVKYWSQHSPNAHSCELSKCFICFQWRRPYTWTRFLFITVSHHHANEIIFYVYGWYNIDDSMIESLIIRFHTHRGNGSYNCTVLIRLISK